MQLFHLLSFALLAAANEKCCEVPCYKALDNAPRGHSASADCRAFQITTVTPCPTTVTKTAKGSVETSTVTSTYGQPATTPKAKIVEKNKALVASPDCTTQKSTCANTGKPAGVPGYATKACKTSDYASACSCLGVTKTTTTLPRSTITSTHYDCSTTTTTKVVTPTTKHVSTTTCAANNCFGGILTLPIISTIASDFCKTYITVTDSTVTVTAQSTVTSFSTNIPSAVTPPPVTETDTSYSLVTAMTSCTVTSTTTTITTVTDSAMVGDLATTRFFISGGMPAASAPAALHARSVQSIPSQLIQGCSIESSLPSILSSACSCIIKPTTTTMTVTFTSSSVAVTTATASTLATLTVTTETTLPSTVTTVCGPSTATVTATATSTLTVPAVVPSCGVAVPAVALSVSSGTITCSAVALPSVNEYTRIEGNDSNGLVFEGCIVSAPGNVTTPSGGTHSCDGTNNGANPTPRANGITQIVSAANANNFGYDGSFSANFDDFFITSIGASTQTGSEFWGILTNQAFTPAGGCETEVSGGTEELLWAFNAFNVNYFLTISPQYAVVPVGTQSLTLNIQGHDGNGDSATPISGAAVQGGSTGTSDGNGNIVITLPSAPGCYEYKATRADSIRSNIFYLSVVA